MTDLLEVSRLFEASSRIDSAANILRKLTQGESPNLLERETLVWAGNFLIQVDWTSGNSSAVGSVGNLTVQATAVRPTFYAALIGIERRLREAGLNEDKQIAGFLRKLYQFLVKGGITEKNKRALPADKLQLAVVFLRELADGLLIQLTDNGAPKENDLLLGCSI